MQNQPNFYDYALDGDTIRVWPSEDKGPAVFEAAQFFSWLVQNRHATDYHFEKQRAVAIDQTQDGELIWLSWPEWWSDPFIIYNPLKPIPAGVDLIDHLLHNFIADQCDGDERTLAQLPEFFLTADEKAAKKSQI